MAFASPPPPPLAASLAHPSIFQPPAASPIASPRLSTATDYFSPRSRKRAHPGSSHHDTCEHQHLHPQTPWTATPSWVQCPTPSDGVYGSAGAADVGIVVNDRYRLAGGFDTPSLLAMADEEQEHHERCGGDGEWRRRVRDAEPSDAGFRNRNTLSGPLARERNGVARAAPANPSGTRANGGGGLVSFTFGLVGRVFTFGSTMISGFYAGSGKGFELRRSSPVSLSNSWMPNPRSTLHREHTPVPGAWQDDDEDEFLGDFEQDNVDSPSAAARHTRPPNKRRQTDRDTWVLVDTPDARAADAAELSPRRKSSRSSSIPRTAPLRPGASTRNSASGMGRKSLAPISRRASAHVSHAGSPHSANQPHHPNQHNTPNMSVRRASLAPLRSNHSRPSSSGAGGGVDTSYITPEAERIIKRQARQDKAAERAMSSMSRRLEEMIRQGQEALGTRVSVEDGRPGGGLDVEMEGHFVDEEW